MEEIEMKDVVKDVETIVKQGLGVMGMHPLLQQLCFLELNVAERDLTSLEFMKSYPNIVYLDISNNSIESLQPLEKMMSLVQLNAR